MNGNSSMCGLGIVKALCDLTILFGGCSRQWCRVLGVPMTYDINNAASTIERDIHAYGIYVQHVERGLR